jgi:hypothetical protein
MLVVLIWGLVEAGNGKDRTAFYVNYRALIQINFYLARLPANQPDNVMGRASTQKSRSTTFLLRVKAAGAFLPLKRTRKINKDAQ